MENAWGNLNNTLLGLASLILGQKQQNKQNARSDLETMMGLGNQMGITPEMYAGIQESAKKAGLQFPDMSTFQQKQAPVSNGMQQQPQDIMSILAGLGQAPNSPMQQQQQQQQQAVPSKQPISDTQGLAPEEQALVGPAKSYKDFSDEVSFEMGINPDNLVGGEPLKKFRQESFMRYRQYLKDRDSQIKGLMMENRRESRQMKVEDKRWKERMTMEDKKEEARFKLEAEKERIGDERQAQRDTAAERRQGKALSAADRRLEKSLSASDKRLMKTLNAAEQRAFVRERGSMERLNKREAGAKQRIQIKEGYTDKRSSKREAGVESRFERRREDKKERLDVGGTKQKLITIYADDGRTKMVPIPLDKEYTPPAGWSISKPGKEDKVLRQLQTPKSQGKVPVYNINGQLLRYE